MGWNDYKDEMNFYDAINLYDNTYLVIGIRPKIEVMHFFLTDGENFAKSVRLSTEIDNIKSKNKIDNLSLFIKDFDYDMKNDFLVITFYTDGKKIESFYSYQYDGNINKYLIETKATSFFADFNYDEVLEVLSYNSEEESYCGIYNLFDYQDFSSDLIKSSHTSQVNWTKDRISKIVRDFDYYVQFCIVRQKRGILLKKYYYSDDDKYQFKYHFYYWSPSEQRCILDENVTQEQLQNAYCPEDYFAYNGLKFSKLDSKLIDADLKDLDKAQLRLMRNAVYARHGRTFKSVDLQSLWECYTWYKKNPSYNDDLLTDIDKYNIELIQKYEQK